MSETSCLFALPVPVAAALPLAGRHAVVTGANGGIGAAICQQLAAQGATLTLLGRKRAELEAVRAALPVTLSVAASAALAMSAAGGADIPDELGEQHGIAVADVTDCDAIAQAIAQAAAARGPVGVLVNNAGMAQSAPFGKTDAALWQKMIDVNLGGTYHCIQAALPGMLEADWGRIVNVASTAGLTGYAYVAAYCAAKHGVIGLTRALALEVATRGVTVNAVCPGYTDTPLLTGAIGNIVAKTGRSENEARATLAAGNPQRRLVQPQEVANAVTWLCLPGAESIHGQSIAVAGGEVM